MCDTKLIFFVFLFALQNVFAQNPEFDSLQQALKNAATDTVKARLLNKISTTLWYSDPNLSLDFAKKALKLAQELDYQGGMKAAYNNIGVINEHQGNYPEALQCFLKTLKISEQTHDIKTMARALNNIGVLYKSLNEDSLALHYYERSLEIKERLEDKNGIALAYSNLGVVYGTMGDMAKALDYHLKALKIREETAYRRGIANSLNNVGRIYAIQGDLDLAKDCFNKSLVITKELDDKIGLAYSLQNLASVYYEKQKYRSALSYALQSFRLAGEIDAKLHIKEASKVLFQTYEAMQNYQKAFEYQTIYMNYRDTLMSEENKRKIANLQSSYEIQERDAEIALLNKDKRLHEAESKRLNAEAERKNLLLLATTICSILFILLALILVRYSQQQKKANLLLQKKNEEIRTTYLNLKVSNQEIKLRNEEVSEQKKILEELNGIKDRLFSIIAHDFRSPLNSLQGTLSLLHIEAISYDEIKKVLPGIIKKVDHTVSLLDNLLNWARTQLSGMKIRPDFFDLQSVAEETVHLLKSQAYEKGILLHNLIPPHVPVYADPEMVKLILRNLVSNAIKFTNKGDVISVKVYDNEDYCRVAIADTGCGIDKNKLKYLFLPGNSSTLGTSNEKGTGLGLWICKDFTEKNGGAIWVESEKGKGSTFYFTLPKSMTKVTKPSVAIA